MGNLENTYARNFNSSYSSVTINKSYWVRSSRKGSFCRGCLILTSACSIPSSCIASGTTWNFLKTPASLPPQHLQLLLEGASLPHQPGCLLAFKIKFQHLPLHKPFVSLLSLFPSSVLCEPLPCITQLEMILGTCTQQQTLNFTWLGVYTFKK